MLDYNIDLGSLIPATGTQLKQFHIAIKVHSAVTILH